MDILNIHENPDKIAFKVKPGRIVGDNFFRSIRGVKTCAQPPALPISWFARGLAFVHVDWLFHNQLQNLWRKNIFCKTKEAGAKFMTWPSIRIQRRAKISVPQWWNMNLWSRSQLESKLISFFSLQLLLFRWPSRLTPSNCKLGGTGLPITSNKVGMMSIWEVGWVNREPGTMPPAGHLKHKVTKCLNFCK